MKLTSHVYSFLSVALLILRSSVVAEQLSNDPPSYFGGANHQAYLDWVANNAVDAKYDYSVFIPSKDRSSGAAVHWRVDDEYLHVAVAARCSGWIGFGISEAGGMFGSDMALFSSSRPEEIVDAHVVDVAYPKKDDCQQDWELVDSFSALPITALSSRAATGEEEFLMFEARRKLDTGDPQDKKIINDSDPSIPAHRVIAAWGDDAEATYHGPNVARGSIRFFGTKDEERTFNEAMGVNAEGSFVVGASNFVIPANETTYRRFCFSRDDLIAQGVPNTTDVLNMIGFRPVVPEGPSAPFVHHFVVTGGYKSSDLACAGFSATFDMVYVWAPGDGPFALPDFLGSHLFGPGGFQTFTIEIHYDNPRNTRDVVDSSGVQIYYTSQAREMEMGIANIGDPMLQLLGEPVGAGLSSHSFVCPGSCSQSLLQEPVTVIREYLHMHATGSRMTSEQVNPQGETVRSSAVEVWDFDQNGNYPPLQDPFVVQPGDSFRTTCYYRGADDTAFGLGSREEMCMSFLVYYPKQVEVMPIAPNVNMTIPWTCGYNMEGFNNACNASYDKTMLENNEQLHREFGTANQTQCALNAKPEEESHGSYINDNSSVEQSEEESASGSFLSTGVSSSTSTSGAGSVVAISSWMMAVASLMSLTV